MWWLHTARHVAIQVLRRLVQVAVLGIVVGMAYLSLYAHYRAAHVLDDETEMVGFRGQVLRRIDAGVGRCDDPQRLLDDNKGTIWSMRIAGWDLTDPLAAAEAIAATHSIYRPLVTSILIPVVLTLLLGKVFCSWICPGNLLFEVAGKLRRLLRFAEIPPAEVEFSRKNKYVLLAVGLAVAAVVGLPIFALVYPPAAVSRLIHAWIFGTSLAGTLLVLGLIVVVEVVVSPRWWCRTMCPGGALYGLIGWPRLLRVKLDAARCTQCRECVPVCQPGLDPVYESDGIECDNCGQCVRHCPERALRYTLALPLKSKGPDAKARPPVVRLTATLGLLLAVVFSPSAASAHHILGLPHYSYKENYPQVPVLEYPAKAGPYHVLLQCYPGKPTPGKLADLAFYIKNEATGQPYPLPVRVRVLETFTFGQSREILPPTDVTPFDGLHKISATFPQDGEYVVELTMDVEGREEVIGFQMLAGNPSATPSILIAIGVGLAIFLITVRAIKKKRDRRQRQQTRAEPAP